MASARQQLEAIRRLLEIAVGSQGHTAMAPLLRLVTDALSGRHVSLPGGLRKLLREMTASANLGGTRSAGAGKMRQPEDPFRPYVPPVPGTPPMQPPGQITRSPEVPRSGQRKYFPEGYPSEQSFFSDEFLAPTSSNVYSFQYFRRPHDRLGILFVTYKASNLKVTGLSVGQGRFKGGRRQLHGRPGHVHSVGKSNAPGPTYAYLKVPPALFTRMKQAHSKGKFVWDELRVRGTVYGHKFRYNLVVGQLLDVPGAQAMQYIPRKATPRGFVTRSVADIGAGRRGFVSSTLPPSSTGGGGFTTRRP